MWILLHIKDGAAYALYVQFCRPPPDSFVEWQLCTGMIGPEDKTCNLLGETLLEVRWGLEGSSWASWSQWSQSCITWSCSEQRQHCVLRSLEVPAFVFCFPWTAGMIRRCWWCPGWWEAWEEWSLGTYWLQQSRRERGVKPGVGTGAGAGCGASSPVLSWPDSRENRSPFFFNYYFFAWIKGRFIHFPKLHAFQLCSRCSNIEHALQNISSHLAHAQAGNPQRDYPDLTNSGAWNRITLNINANLTLTVSLLLVGGAAATLPTSWNLLRLPSPIKQRRKGQSRCFVLLLCRLVGSL